MLKNAHALDTGAQLVRMGDIPSLVCLQAQPIWEISDKTRNECGGERADGSDAQNSG
jgi:hypothetical protein